MATNYPSYRKAVAWIALNDAPADEVDREQMASYLTVVLIADLYGRDAHDVAKDVLKHRATHCTGCGEAFTKKDIDGGRCLSCGVSIIAMKG